MSKYMFSLLLILLGTSAQAARVKDVATVEGVRHNQLVGYGLVVGLPGTGEQSPFTEQSFKTMLAMFLLEMGLCTARACSPMPWQHWRLMIFAVVAPFVLAWAGIATALLLQLPEGSALVLAGLCASASYIAAPAAIRVAVPGADIGLAMLAALGITFPVNVLIGIPLYQQWLGWFY